jgi:hypothetical protein
MQSVLPLQRRCTTQEIGDGIFCRVKTAGS